MNTNPITLIFEFNFYLGYKAGTIWFVPRAIVDTREIYNNWPEDSSNWEKEKLAVKVVGPIDQGVALKTYDKLVECMNLVGLECRQLSIADD